MVLNTKELIDGIGILMEERNLRVTLRKSAKGALICGVTCFIGALVGGPVGIAVGGAIGTAGAYKMTKGQFKSVGEILRNDLSDSQREKLLQHIIQFVNGLELTDAVVALEMMKSSESLLSNVQNVVISFIEKEIKMQIVD